MKTKKHLSFTSLRRAASEVFRVLEDKRRQKSVEHIMHDAMMSGLACMYFQEPSLMQFQRSMEKVRHNNKLQVFEIQWDKSHRPLFVVNFGEASSDGCEFFGNYIGAEFLEPQHCPVKGRLQRWRGGSMRTWFQISKPWRRLCTR